MALRKTDTAMLGDKPKAGTVSMANYLLELASIVQESWLR
jgi:hypothetical protein